MPLSPMHYGWFLERLCTESTRRQATKNIWLIMTKHSFQLIASVLEDLSKVWKLYCRKTGSQIILLWNKQKLEGFELYQVIQKAQM